MTPILRPVDVRDVRNLVYWLNEEYQATLGMIATTSKFTKNARDLVELRHRWRISLKDQATIIGLYPGFPTVKGENLTDLICTGKLI